MSNKHGDIIENEIRPLVAASEWESPRPGEEQYSTNQMIAAYEAGKVKGMMGAEQLVQEQIVENINQAGRDTSRVIDGLVKIEIQPRSARLRVESWKKFEVLITVSQEDFVSAGFDEVYDIVRKVEESTHTSKYCISYRFCPETEHFNEVRAKVDGFTLRHKALMK